MGPPGNQGGGVKNPPRPAGRPGVISGISENFSENFWNIRMCNIASQCATLTNIFLYNIVA